ncbi:MAG: ABC transporter permease subunit [Deltaproteobacteria bacterium]|nr:ABC transporter permease subunit [Deltaproteobacteria bacterium]
MKVLSIALNTAREAIRNKVLYSIMLFALLLVGVAAVFGAASIGDQMKFIKDFSLLSISLFGVITTVVLGVNLLNKELGKRTIFNILAKPVARWQFILGKFLGLLATVAVMVALMSAALLIFLRGLEPQVDWRLLLAATSVVLELMVLIALALFFSSIVVTPALAGLFTAAAFVTGRSASYLRAFGSDEYPPIVQQGSRLLYAIVPHLDRFNIADQVIFGERFSPWYFAHIVLYAVCYTALTLLLSVALFQRREFT